MLESLEYLEKFPRKEVRLNFRRLYTSDFWWPHLRSNGAEAWSFAHSDRMKIYHTPLQQLASNYKKSANRFCAKYDDLGSIFDKANKHPLLKLSLHTTSRSNHISYICELFIESALQPLEFYLSHSTSTKSHLYSVLMILAKAWL